MASGQKRKRTSQWAFILPGKRLQREAEGGCREQCSVLRSARAALCTAASAGGLAYKPCRRAKGRRRETPIGLARWLRGSVAPTVPRDAPGLLLARWVMVLAQHLALTAAGMLCADNGGGGDAAGVDIITLQHPVSGVSGVLCGPWAFVGARLPASAIGRAGSAARLTATSAQGHDAAGL